MEPGSALCKSEVFPTVPSPLYHLFDLHNSKKTCSIPPTPCPKTCVSSIELSPCTNFRVGWEHSQSPHLTCSATEEDGFALQVPSHWDHCDLIVCPRLQSWGDTGGQERHQPVPRETLSRSHEPTGPRRTHRTPTWGAWGWGQVPSVSPWPSHPFLLAEFTHPELNKSSPFSNMYTCMETQVYICMCTDMQTYVYTCTDFFPKE